MKATVEHEVKLRVPPDFVVPSMSRLPGADLVSMPAQSLETIYYDTRDLRLARWGISVRSRVGEDARGADDVATWTVKLPEGDDGPAVLRREVVLEAPARVVPEEVTALVRAYVRGSLVAPVVILRSERRRHRVRIDGVDVAEIDDDDVSVVDEGRVVLRFRELEVERVDGAPPRALRSIVQALCDHGAALTDGTNKLVQALGEDVLGEPEVVVPELTKKASTGEVARAAIAGGVLRLLRHDPGTRLGGDSEDVHQARVATRRLRSDLRTFEKILDAEAVAGLRGELRWLGQVLGVQRDNDVLLDRLRSHVSALDDADARPGTALVRRVEDEREAARAALLDALSSDRYLSLLDALVRTARRPPLVSGAEERARDVLVAMVDHQVRRLRRAVGALPDDPEEGDLHAVRIRAKRARYATEASQPLLGKKADRLAKAVASLQSVLGDLNDSVVAEAWLRAAATGASAAQAFVAGELVMVQRHERVRARAAWRDAWEAVDEEHRRWRS